MAYHYLFSKTRMSGALIFLQILSDPGGNWHEGGLWDHNKNRLPSILGP